MLLIPCTKRAMTRQNLRELTSSVLKINAVYCRVFFANRIKSRKHIFLIKLNVKTSSRKLKQISYEKHQHKTDLLTPNHISPSPTIASFTFLATIVAAVRTLFTFFFFPDGKNCELLWSSVSDIDCYLGVEGLPNMHRVVSQEVSSWIITVTVIF
jgi:hypothetical protein